MGEPLDILFDAFRKTPEVCIDSRNVTPGCLFFGLPGSNVDGSAFAAGAIRDGAALAVVREGSCAQEPGIVFVPDPLRALQDLARRYRDTLAIPVIGITGSNGKTTTKELVHRVLSRKFKTCATRGNLNNHIGVPLTLLSIKPDDVCAIIEMGANHQREIALLCDLAKPTHGLVTNIGQAHLEGFGGIEGVKKGKGELFDALADSGGVAFVSSDEPFLDDLSARVAHRIHYGSAAVAGYAENQYDFSIDNNRVTFMDAEGNTWTAESRLFGVYNIRNIMTAIAFGISFGVSGEQICAAISAYVPQNNRSQILQLGSNTLILDAYNANPSSMSGAIRSFAIQPAEKKMLILGAMMELGEYGAEAHARIGQEARNVPEADVYLVGDAFREVAKQLGVQWFPDVESLSIVLRSLSLSDMHILIKGSRAMRLELLTDALQ